MVKFRDPRRKEDVLRDDETVNTKASIIIIIIPHRAINRTQLIVRSGAMLDRSVFSRPEVQETSRSLLKTRTRFLLAVDGTQIRSKAGASRSSYEVCSIGKHLEHGPPITDGELPLRSMKDQPAPLVKSAAWLQHCSEAFERVAVTWKFSSNGCSR